MKKQNKQKGITLVALVITIIVLIILAGIAIQALTNQGLFAQAEAAKKSAENAQIEEEQKLGDYENKIGEYVEGTREQIVVDKEEYEQLKARVTALEAKTNFITPIYLATAVLPSSNTSTRAAGTYKASSSLYTKTSSEDLSKYLTFEEGTGWTVKKSGFYYFNAYEKHNYINSAGDIETHVLINGIRYRLTIQHVNPNHANSSIAGQMTMYLKENDVIDFSFIPNASGNYSTAYFNIYAMFE